MQRFARSLTAPLLLLTVLLAVPACSTPPPRGIADKRSQFERFLPMTRNPSEYGLRAVRPYFKTARRAEILRIIERACTGGKAGSSDYDPRTGAGYYVNCNPQNRQLLNGFVPADAHQRPRSR
jgi:hypothetical protein